MKCRILVFIFALFFLPFQKVTSQTIQNDVIASAGDAWSVGNAAISWTLGESIIDSYQSGNIFISQGFHQPVFNFFEIHEQQIPVFHINIYPNPTNRFIWVDLKDPSGTEIYRLVLNDMIGQVLMDRIITADNHEQLDLAEFSRGILLLKVIRVSDGSQRTFKVVRTDY